MGKKVLKVLLAIGLVLVVVIVWAVVMVWRRPLKVDAAISRIALANSGMVKSWVATPAGRMSVWEGGAGQPMVLLHGANDQAGAWARIVPSLIGTYRLIIPDLPGHWKSDPRDGPLGIDQVLSGVEVVMESHAAGEPAILVGNSMGAWVAMLYAHDYPADIDRVVAVNGGPIRNDNTTVTIYPTTREQAAETMKALMGPATPPLPGFVLDDVIRYARVGPAGRLAETADRMAPYLLDGRLGEIVVPVELVWGDADGLLTSDYANRLLDGLPRARLFEVHGCGHLPQRECPDKMVEALLTALAEPPPPLPSDEAPASEGQP